MDAPLKRTCDTSSDGDDGESRKKSSFTDCDRFLAWCKETGICQSEKVTVRREGSCAQCGMIALEDISKGETLFTIPRHNLLHPENCSEVLAKRLNDDSSQLKSKSGWVPLILAVMYEYTNPDSRWRPYLDLFPDYTQLDQPMFWDSDLTEKELKGTGIPEAVERDSRNISQEFQQVALPFIQKNADLFSTDKHMFDLYKKTVAFVMAYSFTEPADLDDDDEDDDADVGCGGCGEAEKTETKSNSPMMVPLADALNHIAKNNAHLNFGTDKLSMVATRDIKQGSEVFNTYGELANWQLLHMYGFAEEYPENLYDTVDIPNEAILEQARAVQTDEDLLDDQWEFLEEVGVVTDEGSFVIGVDGVLTEEELYTTLKVLAMGQEEFTKYQSDEGWGSDDGHEESLSNADLPNLPAPWRRLLSGVAGSCLNDLDSHHASDNHLSSHAEQFAKLDSRGRYAFHVRNGQRKLLERLLELCGTDS